MTKRPPESAAQAALPAEEERLRAANAELKKQLDLMRGLAFRDQLTGLYSRHYLTDYLEREIEEASRETNTVLALCDIDDFKVINDVRGHQSGDIAIACIADILDDLAGGHPVIRWGGEELLAVLFASPDHEALRLCNRMREEVAAYRIDDGAGEFSCTLTFGLGSYDPALSFAENFSLIDRALYHGKETGKNRCVFARPDLLD
ncbi:GGDEF domain-containing protein [Arabiibacter massiliensis]|uniref:GGDEF domain-containing protein n=1 Tax=Arabiibacter massiliensis TaxID=1870985 RepID=UPI001E5DBBA2|nr:GGDEF domain-containing protein [Arabiibacter massiliensis]